MEALSAAKSSASLAGPPAPLNRPKAQNPPTLTMVMEAVKTLDERKGASVVAIKHYILGTYPGVDPIRLKYGLNVAVAKGLERGCLIRPQNSSALGATGRFKLGPKKPRERRARKSIRIRMEKQRPDRRKRPRIPWQSCV
ncbi:protein B4-like [Podarcis muralis]